VEKEMKALKLPETDSIEEMARFWDSHDLTDFEDQLEEVSEPVFERPRERVMVLRLGVEEVQAAEEIAKSRGLGESELLREWGAREARCLPHRRSLTHSGALAEDLAPVGAVQADVERLGDAASEPCGGPFKR